MNPIIYIWLAVFICFGWIGYLHYVIQYMNKMLKLAFKNDEIMQTALILFSQGKPVGFRVNGENVCLQPLEGRGEECSCGKGEKPETKIGKVGFTSKEKDGT